MAKRRRLETPTAAELEEAETAFRNETALRPKAPIAQVAGDAAALSEPDAADVRVARARDATDAARLHKAEAEGLVMAQIPLDQIDADAMIRDRMVLDAAEMDELKQSIAANGLRLPIEVFELPDGQGGPRYGLLSGYRRLLAMRGLAELKPGHHTTIKSVVRPRGTVDAAYAAMIEENEIRSPLSHFERGRIAVIAAQQGAFANTEDAVERLFATASRSKRSKVRSFAAVFEELGDMLSYPEVLTERRGLAVAGALRDGAEPRLREVLGAAEVSDPDEEWSLLEAVIEELNTKRRSVRRGGRPKVVAPKSGWHGEDTLQTSTGITIRRETDSQGHVIRLSGKGLDVTMMESLMLEIRALLEKA